MNATIVTSLAPTPQESWRETVQALGSLDALDGHPFCPEMYVTRHCDKVAYAEGYEAIAGRTPSSDIVMGRTLSDEAMLEETLDYADDILFREWIRQGGA